MSIDKQRVRAVEKLLELGFEFKDNNWVGAVQVGKVDIGVDEPHKEAYDLLIRNSWIWDEKLKVWAYRGGGNTLDQLNKCHAAIKEIMDYFGYSINYKLSIKQILQKYGVNL